MKSFVQTRQSDSDSNTAAWLRVACCASVDISDLCLLSGTSAKTGPHGPEPEPSAEVLLPPYSDSDSGMMFLAGPGQIMRQRHALAVGDELLAGPSSLYIP